MNSEERNLDPREVIAASRDTGVGVIRYRYEEQVKELICNLKAIAPYTIRSALPVAEDLYGYMRQYKDHPEIAAYLFQEMLEKEQGLIITHWQDIAQRK